MFSFIALLLSGAGAEAQVFSFGAKLGVPLTNADTVGFVADGGAFADEQRFTVGPTAEVHLPFRLAVEVDALWRAYSFSSISAHPGLNGKSSVNDWQFPFLLKYALTGGPIHPFVDGGVVYRHVSTASSLVEPPNNPNTAGWSAGAGITLKILHLELSPEIRYTRWPTQPFGGPDGPIISTNNQADVLFGITF